MTTVKQNGLQENTCIRSDKAAANWKLKPGLENISYFGLIISNNLTGEKKMELAPVAQKQY